MAIELLQICYCDTYVYIDTTQLIVEVMTNRVNSVTLSELRSIPK